MNFDPQMVIKGPALADFIIEFTYSNAVEVTGIANITEVAKAAGVSEREDFIPIKGDVE